MKNEIFFMSQQLVEPVNYSEGIGKTLGEPSNIIFLRRDPQRRINHGSTLKQRHERYALTINLRREGLVCVEGQTYHLPVDFASLVQPLQLHYYMVDQSDFTWLVITFEMTKQDFVKKLPAGCVAITDLQFINIYRMLQIYIEILSGKSGQEQLLQRMLGNFLREMSVADNHVSSENVPQTNGSKNINEFERINKYIFSRIHDPSLCVNDIAEALDISITRLYGVFKVMSECNPGDYIRTQRIRRAMRMLKTPGIPVSEVAKQNGFSSLAIFSRSFKNIVGCSPSQFIRDNSQNRIS